MESYRNVLHERSKRSEGRRLKAGLKTLDELETWRLNELPKLVNSRNPPYITSDELGELVQLKLLRGKFRPRLQQLADSNPDKLVRKTSQDAFEKLAADVNPENLKAALSTLATLKGIGPATASLILCILYDIPFMSDPAYLHAFGETKKIEYTLKRCVELYEKWIVLAENESCSCRELELKVWTNAERGSTTAATPSTKNTSTRSKKKE